MRDIAGGNPGAWAAEILGFFLLFEMTNGEELLRVNFYVAEDFLS